MTPHSVASRGLVVAAIALTGARTVAAADVPDPTRADRPLPGAIWVESLDLTKMSKRGRWPVGAARSTGGNPLRIAGVTYPHGVGTHAPGGLRIRLDGGASRFVARVGVDDERATEYGTGSVVFEVWVDDRLALATPVLRQGASQLVDVYLRGARTLELVTMDGDDGSNGDHADWAGAQIVLVAGASPPQAFIPDPEPAPELRRGDLRRPRLNGPRIVGASPGKPFVFRIAATGAGPLTFGAKGLPAGLALDRHTGIITGDIAQAGRSNVTLAVSGSAGQARATLTIVAGERQLALTPPMGWSSWNAFGTTIDQAKIRATADALVRTGLAGFGYQYVNVDDGWTDGRDQAGQLRVAAKMGDLRSLSDHIHGLGLRFGVYSSPGPKTCGGYVGSLGHEEDDARSMAAWGVDYFKHDWCSYETIVPDERDLRALQKPYEVMRTALDRIDRDVVYAVCQYGVGRVWEWGASPAVGGNLWRTTGDLIDSWGSMWGIGFGHHAMSPYARPGGWNDPDMLVVGVTGGWAGESRPSRLSRNEQITHLTQWSMLAAPLILGCDLDKLDEFTLALLTNEEVIAIDQDALGKAATRRSRVGRTEVWARELEDGGLAVALYNLGWARTAVTADWAALGVAGPRRVRDLWQRKDLGVHDGRFTADVPQHGAVLIRLAPASAARRGRLAPR